MATDAPPINNIFQGQTADANASHRAQPSDTEMRGQHSSGTSTPAHATSSGAQDEEFYVETQSSVRIGDKRLFDITKELMNAAKEIPVGSLVKHDSFELFEAVGAIEVMDPRMDTGYLVKQEDSLDDDFDFDKPLSPEQILGIMDELLCVEMAWHQGHPILQTIFTSLHIDRLLSSDATALQLVHFSDAQAQMQMKDAEGNHVNAGPSSMTVFVLRAYCISLIVCCDSTIIRVTSGNPIYYEDEDISTNTFNRDMLGRFEQTYDQAMDLCDEAILWLTGCKELDIDGEIRQALIDRLGFRMLFLDVTASDAIEPQRFTHEAQKFATIFEESHGLAQKYDVAFSDKIQRRLASTQPPRPTVKPDFVDAIKEFLRLCKDCQDATDILSLRSGEEQLFDSPWEVEGFLWAFMSRTPEPHPLTRSFLQSLVIRGVGRDDMPHWQRFLAHELSQTVLPGVINPSEVQPTQPWQDRDEPTLRTFQEFSHIVIPVQYGFADYFRILCQNRCRLRRLLHHHIKFLEDLEPLISELSLRSEEVLPAVGDAFPLDIWIKRRKLRSLEHIIRLGFDQDLYEPDELEVQYMMLGWVTNKRGRLCIRLSENMRRVKTEAKGSVLCEREAMGIHLSRIEASRNAHLMLTTFHVFQLYRLLRNAKGVRQLLLESIILNSFSQHVKDCALPAYVSQQLKTAFAMTEDLHKQTNAVVSSDRKNEAILSSRSRLPDGWMDKHMNDLVMVLVKLGLARKRLHKLWIEDTIQNYEMVIPPPEERTLASWIVPHCKPKVVKK